MSRKLPKIKPCPLCGREDDLEYLSQKEVYTLESLQKVMRHARHDSQKVYVPGAKRYVPLKDLELTPVMVERFAPVVVS